MSASVDYAFYADVYMGTEADAASFPALCARATDVVGALTRWADVSNFPEHIQTLYKKAVCAQVDFFAVNGLDAVAGGNDRGFTVGKVSISGKAGSGAARAGAMAENLSPMVILYLEQTGLMAPQVSTGIDMPLVGWF